MGGEILMSDAPTPDTSEIKVDTGTDELLCVIRDRVAIITLNRPEVRNAIR
jgi:enoyl-CoA hydratase/carnithine racemase